ncbi:MAG: hypothetical protein IMZ62_01910 [Chloroflexi bacterium]|nr:hypothetical protein [Chloroflexota bacterium]
MTKPTGRPSSFSSKPHEGRTMVFEVVEDQVDGLAEVLGWTALRTTLLERGLEFLDSLLDVAELVEEARPLLDRTYGLDDAVKAFQPHEDAAAEGEPGVGAIVGIVEHRLAEGTHGGEAGPYGVGCTMVSVE